MLGVIASVFAGASGFDMAMMGINAVGAIGGLFSKNDGQEKIIKAQMKQLDTQRDILKMTTDFNIKEINKSYLENFGRMNNEYASARLDLSNKFKTSYDDMVISMGNNSGIDRSESIQRKSNYLQDTFKTAGISLSDNEKQDFLSLSKNTIQSLINQQQNYNESLTEIGNNELNLMAELENVKKKNEISGIKNALNSLMNIGNIAVGAYKNDKLYNDKNNNYFSEINNLDELFDFSFKDLDLSLYPRV